MKFLQTLQQKITFTSLKLVALIALIFQNQSIIGMQSEAVPVSYETLSSSDLHKMIDDLDAIDKPLEDGRTVLHVAVMKRDVGACRKIVGRGANVNKGDSEDRTPLHYAAAMNATEIVKLLLERGAHLILTDGRGRTVLHEVCEAGAVNAADLVFKSLLEIIANPSNRALNWQEVTRGEREKFSDDSWKESDLAKKLAGTNYRNMVIDEFDRRNRMTAKIKVDELKKMEPFDAIWALGSAAVHGRGGEVASVLREVLPVNEAEEQANKEQRLAALDENEAFVRYFTLLSMVLRSQDIERHTPLHLASCGGFVQLCERMLFQEQLFHLFDTDAQDKDGNTALHLAGTEEVCELLLKKRLNYKKRNNNQQLPLDVFISKGWSRAVSLILEEGALIGAESFESKDVSMFLHSAAKRDLDLLQLLLRNIIFIPDEPVQDSHNILWRVANAINPLASEPQPDIERDTFNELLPLIRQNHDEGTLNNLINLLPHEASVVFVINQLYIQTLKKLLPILQSIHESTENDEIKNLCNPATFDSRMGIILRNAIARRIGFQVGKK